VKTQLSLCLGTDPGAPVWGYSRGCVPWAKGPTYARPGRRPGRIHGKSRRALKGRVNASLSLYAPLQGSLPICVPPRALPWAGIRRAFGPQKPSGSQSGVRRLTGCRSLGTDPGAPVWGYSQGCVPWAKGPTYASPGQRPGRIHGKSRRALKGRVNASASLYAPLQGSLSICVPPRALPWAGMRRAFGPQKPSGSQSGVRRLTGCRSLGTDPGASLRALPGMRRAFGPQKPSGSQSGVRRLTGSVPRRPARSTRRPLFDVRPLRVCRCGCCSGFCGRGRWRKPIR
jgi:hypothetical protein